MLIPFNGYEIFLHVQPVILPQNSYIASQLEAANIWHKRYTWQRQLKSMKSVVCTGTV